MIVHTFQGFDEPEENWSKLPNALIDALPLIKSLGELKVILYVLRHTWGFHDDQKRITLDEFQHGRKRRDGTRIDHGVGLSDRTIRDGIQEAIEHGFLEREEAPPNHPGKPSYIYRLKSVETTNSNRQNLPIESAESTDTSEKETKERNPRNNTLSAGSVLDEIFAPWSEADEAPSEPILVPAGDEFGDDDDPRRPPAWTRVEPTDMLLRKALDATGGKSAFTHKAEPELWARIRERLADNSLPQEWVDSCITFASTKKMPFRNLAKYILNDNKRREWQQQRRKNK